MSNFESEPIRRTRPPWYRGTHDHKRSPAAKQRAKERRQATEEGMA